MSCGGCTPNKSSLEYTRRRKPENSNGCGCGRASNTCETPSYAIEGSALYEWEQVYGKLVTTIKTELNNEGRWVQVVEKKPCEPKVKKDKNGYCAISYRVNC